ncbi:MAG TPA: division/cell wall cluster transcriptional repressor MraZ [Polyangiales bacterium]|nr:division/cell wall cluster transcriptional repressor MraZ [Polyangiales bacterium]
MFRGKHEHAIDGKGRTSLPSRFREILAGEGDVRLMLTTGFENCIVCYPMRAWADFEAKLLGMSEFEPEAADMRLFYLASAEEVDVDSVGRMLVPQMLRKHAGLDRQAIWVGMGKNLQLWDKDRWEAKLNGALLDPERVAAARRRAAGAGL